MYRMELYIRNWLTWVVAVVCEAVVDDEFEVVDEWLSCFVGLVVDSMLNRR